MQEAYFVFPDKARLPGASKEMRGLYEELKQAAVTRETAELRSLACVAMLILEELMEKEG